MIVNDDPDLSLRHMNQMYWRSLQDAIREAYGYIVPGRTLRLDVAANTPTLFPARNIESLDCFIKRRLNGADTSKAPSKTPELSPEIASHLLRFLHLDPSRVQSCAQLSPRVAQLAGSFPLLFAVLTYAYGSPQLRSDAITAAVNGAPLREIARIVGLPYCFRHIRPEACPENLRYHHWSVDAHRQLRPLMPEDDAAIYPWLVTLFIAAQRSDEKVAIWMARQKCLLLLGRLHPEALQPLFMFAWYSLHYPAIVHARGRWTPAINLRSALRRCEIWLKHIALFTELDIQGVADPWLPETHAGALHIVPITTPLAILEEASAMENCVVDYGEFIAEGTCRLFSVREGGRRVATLELHVCPDGQKLIVAEIKGPANKRCPLNIVAQVRNIVSGYQPRSFSTELCRPASERCGLDRCFGPYRQAMPVSEQPRLETLTITKLYVDHDKMSRLARIAIR